MRFGLDAQGVFISGVDAKKLFDRIMKANPQLFDSVLVENEFLFKDLASILNQVDDPSEAPRVVQILKPYWECMKS
jgi:hypothetical protein